MGHGVGQPSDPHRDPHGERAGKGQRVQGRKLALSALLFSLSYMTCSMKLPMVWAASSCFCRVAWVGEPSVVVTQHGRHRFYIHAVLKGCGGEGMPQVVESEMLQSGVLQELLVEVYHAVRVVHLSSQGRGEQVGAVRVFAVLLD